MLMLLVGGQHSEQLGAGEDVLSLWCVSPAPHLPYRENTSQANTLLFCSCAMVISPRLSYAYMSWGDSPLESNSTSQGFLDTRPSPRRGHQCQGSSGTAPSAALMPGTTKFWNHPFPVSPKQQSWAKAIFWGPPVLGIRDMFRFIRKGIITMALHHLWHTLLGCLLGIKSHLPGIPEGACIAAVVFVATAAVFRIEPALGASLSTVPALGCWGQVQALGPRYGGYMIDARLWAFFTGSEFPAPWALDSGLPEKNLPEPETADTGEEAMVFVSELFRDIWGEVIRVMFAWLIMNNTWLTSLWISNSASRAARTGDVRACAWCELWPRGQPRCGRHASYPGEQKRNFIVLIYFSPLSNVRKFWTFKIIWMWK